MRNYVLSLSLLPKLVQVFKIAYCDYFSLKERDECIAICQSFVVEVASCFPDLKKKVKIHLVLHLVDNMVDFGPTSAFNTERYVQSKAVLL